MNTIFVPVVVKQNDDDQLPIVEAVTAPITTILQKVTEEEWTMEPAEPVRVARIEGVGEESHEKKFLYLLLPKHLQKEYMLLYNPVNAEARCLLLKNGLRHVVDEL